MNKLVETFFNKIQDETISMVDRNTYVLESLIEFTKNKNIEIINEIINSEKLYEINY